MTERESQLPQRSGVLEIRNRSGQVQQRIPFEGDRVTIGRAYDNDIIVGDPFVCPHHLVIEAQGDGFELRDLDSVNGSYRGRQRFQSMPLEDGLLVHFGHSQFRFQLSGSSVAETWRDISRQGLLALLNRPWMAFIGITLAMLALIADTWLDSLENLGIGALVADQLYPLIGLLLWTGLWALINRVVSHRANFHVHLAIASLGITMLFIVSQLVGGIGFAFAFDSWVYPLTLGGQILVLALTIYAHLRYSTHGQAPVQAVVSLLAGLLLFGSPAMSRYLEGQNFSTVPHLQPLLRPPGFAISPGQSVESFFEQSMELKDALDSAAKE